MNSPLESGLFLPVRFYNTLAEQDRYKRISQGVALVNEILVYGDCDTLLPFQVILDNYCEEGIASAIITLVCADGVENELTFDPTKWELWSNTTTLTTYISYLGTDSFSGLVSNGRYYIELNVTDMCENTSTYYSDFFMIANCDALYDVGDYRIVSHATKEKRLTSVDPTDLRITTK